MQFLLTKNKLDLRQAKFKVPLNLHKVFLLSIQQHFKPIIQTDIVPIYYSQRFRFIKNYDFIKPVRIVFSRYKERRRSFRS